ncbi:hypothetical protein B0H19DRAFT_1189107 [Mycena capillaripes]|nr:hypothetical protein B0H19DRAFT_1189107 [Mycena capillaripes]
MPQLLPNDPLAAQLNDLAVANSDGLLNDEEYRLLRHNLFERYSAGVEILSVSASPIVKHAPAPRRKHVELVEQPPPRSQVTPSLTPPRSKISGVAGFLRRAAGRRPTSPSPSPSPTPSVIKLSLIPRMFSKKPDDAVSSSDTDSSSGTRHSSSRSFSRKGSVSDLSSPRLKPQDPASLTRPKAKPTSPIRSNFDTAPRSPSRSAFTTGISAPSPSKYDVIPGGSNDIFDDDNLQTSAAIRKAMAAVEAEGRRLVTAFNDLETSAVIRYRREHPQRHRSGTTPSPTPLRPALTPLPSSSGSNRSHTPNRSRSNSQRADAQSVRSNSSLRTAKSAASLFPGPAPPPAFSQSTPPPPTSAWSALSATLKRKGSVSSLSSQGGAPSFLSVPAPRAGLSRSSSMSRSTGHLPLPLPVSVQNGNGSGSGSTMMELLNHGVTPPPDEGGEELAEVRRRRAEMVGRCEARLEYLRAKLKGAEIHEKLLRK